MFMDNLIAPLEAILFASGDPVTNQQLMDVLGIDEDNIQELTQKFSGILKERNSGLVLQQVAGGWQMVTRPDLFSYVEKLTQTRDKKLSQAAMETLSIIAFKQPITKLEIENIRGVRVEKVMQKLLDMELIKELGRKQVLGRPILYGTTDIFLKCFGLNNISDLPELPSADMSQLDAEEQLVLFGDGQQESAEAENDDVNTNTNANINSNSNSEGNSDR